MTTYRFRFKYDPEPTELWRDVVVGADRTIDELQTVLNDAVGLDHEHLWFIGADETYWDSPIQYKRPTEIEESIGGSIGTSTEYDASETTIEEMADQLDLEVGDRICYLYDYGEEWRFYGIVKSIDEDEAGDINPQIVNETGTPVDQYVPPETDEPSRTT
jgi:hypothetical protein